MITKTEATQVGNFTIDGKMPEFSNKVQLLGGSFEGSFTQNGRFDGDLHIPDAFVFAGGRLDVELNARVGGDIRFGTTREGSVGGSLELQVNGYVGKDINFTDETTPGGFAKKRVTVNSHVPGSLTIIVRGRTNFLGEWSVTISDAEDVVCVGGVAVEQSFDGDGNRQVIISAS